MTRQPQLLTQALVGFAFAIGATVTFSQPSHARDPDKFFCGMSNGQPTTIARTSRGNTPIIRWVDDSFPPPWTPARRCEEISARFQRFYRNGLLNYIKAGWSNRQPVLCVAAYKGGACLSNGVLVTLKSGSNPQQVLARLQDRRALASGRTIQLSSDLFSTVDGEMYFNIGGFLTEDDQDDNLPANSDDIDDLPPGYIWDL